MIRLAALLSLTALPALAEGGPRASEIDALVAAIVTNGCVVNDANQAAVLKAAGLDENVAGGVVQRLLDDGRAVSTDNHELRLKTGGCS